MIQMADLDPTSGKKLALLIDADNVRSSFLPIIIREASAIGTIVVRRVYGHFASSTMAPWQSLLHEYALTPVHVPPASRGKNATDMKLAIEAMDLLHQKHLQGICIASSDSDFTRSRAASARTAWKSSALARRRPPPPTSPLATASSTATCSSTRRRRRRRRARGRSG